MQNAKWKVKKWKMENGRSGLFKSVEPKQIEVETRAAIEEKIAKNFTNSAREFKAVPGAGAGDQDIPLLGMPIDEEMPVWCVRVQANCCGIEPAIGVWQESTQERAHRIDFIDRNVASNRLGIREFTVVMPGNFHASAEIGKSVEEMAVFILPQVDRAANGMEEF